MIKFASNNFQMFEALTVGRLRAQYAWLEPLAGGRAPGAAVSSCVYTFTAAAAALCAHNHFLAEPAGLWALLPDFILSFVIIACKFIFLINRYLGIPRKEKNIRNDNNKG